MARIDIKSAGATLSDGVLQLENGVAMDTTLRNVADQNNTTSPLKLSTTAVQVVSPLRITTDDPSDMYLDCEDGATNNRFNITRNTASQQVNLNFASNPAGSTTIVGAIRTYVDGVNLSEVMTFREDGNIGIGTTTPGAKLDVHASVNVVAQFNRTGAGKSWIQFLQAGAGKWNVGYDNTNGNYTIYDVVNSTDRMVVTNAGNVGIGTNTPTTNLTVYGGSNTLGITGAVNQEKSIQIARYNSSDPLNHYIGDDGGAFFGNGLTISASGSNSQLYLQVASSGRNVNIGTAGQTLLPKDMAARLGVRGSGSTSATTSLLVQNSGGTAAFEVKDDRTSNFNGNLILNGQVLYLQNPTSSPNNYLYQASNISILSGVNIRLASGPVGISETAGGQNADASAVLDAKSTTKGFLPPRMTNAQRLAIATPAVGLMVYCTDAVEGLYVYKSTGWTFVI